MWGGVEGYGVGWQGGGSVETSFGACEPLSTTPTPTPAAADAAAAISPSATTTTSDNGQEVNSPYASPVSTSSSSSACESAIPCGPITPVTTAATTTTAAEDVSVGGVDDAEKKKTLQSEVEFDMSSIATATEAVEASTATTPVTESMPDQEVAAATIDTDTEMSHTSTVDDVLESEPSHEEAKSVIAESEHQVVEQSIEHDEQREEEEEQEEKKEEEPLTAAEAFAKSLKAVTATLDPAATQLMDQLRLQEYLRVSVSSISPPTRTPTAMHGSKK